MRGKDADLEKEILGLFRDKKPHLALVKLVHREVGRERERLISVAEAVETYEHGIEWEEGWKTAKEDILSAIRKEPENV